MKKILFFLSFVCLSLGTANAQEPMRFANTLDKQTVGETLANTPAKAEADGFTIQFCNDIYTWYCAVEKNKSNYRCFIYIPAEIASMLAGNKITDIRFSAASAYSTSRKGSVFVSEDLDEDPVTETECEVIDSYGQSQRGKEPYQIIELEEPYEIKANTECYIGYTVKSCRVSRVNGVDYPIGVDGTASNGFSGYAEVTDAEGNELAFFNLGTDTGTNLFIAAKTVGEVTGLENVFMLGNMSLGDFTLPVIDSNESKPLLLPVKNIGANELNSIEYSIDINGVPGQLNTMEMSIAPLAETYIEIPAPELVNGKNNIVLHVQSVNGVAQNLTSSATCIALDNGGYERKFVLEEGTGTWCGYCPRGIVGLDKMSQLYPETFIGIAVHSGDKMATANYAPIISSFFAKGLPSAVINRDPLYVIDPDFQKIKIFKEFWDSQLGAAKVELSVDTDDDALAVKAATTFAYDETGANYRLAFVLLEDGIEDTQSNYYSGYPDQLEWWGNQPETVNWVYEHTARDIFDCFGIEGSIPATIVAGEPMTFAYSLPTNKVNDLSQTSIVALILDAATGTVLNAAKIKAKDYDQPDGIETVALATAPEYFDLLGRHISAAHPGTLVIKRSGQKVKKLLTPGI